MKKTIKLTESKLVEMINNIVSEQHQQKSIDGIVNRFKKTISEQDMAPTSSKPFQIFDDQQERSKSIYSLVAGKGTKRVGFDKEKVEFPVKLLGDSQELITSNAVAQIECVGTYKKIYVFRDNKIIANGYNKAATNYFCNAIRKPLPGTVAPNQKPMMQGGLRQVNEQVSKLRGVEKGYYKGLSSVTGKNYWITVLHQNDGLYSAVGIVIPSDGPFDQYGQYKGKEDYVDLHYHEKDKSFVASGRGMDKKYGVFKLLSYFR